MGETASQGAGECRRGLEATDSRARKTRKSDGCGGVEDRVETAYKGSIVLSSPSSRNTMTEAEQCEEQRQAADFWRRWRTRRN